MHTWVGQSYTAPTDSGEKCWKCWTDAREEGDILRQYLVPSILSLSLTRASPIPFPLRISLSLSLSSIESRYIYCTQILRSTRRYLFLFIIAWKKSSSREEISSIFQSNSITLRELIRLKVYIYIYNNREGNEKESACPCEKRLGAFVAYAVRTCWRNSFDDILFFFSARANFARVEKRERERYRAYSILYSHNPLSLCYLNMFS